MACNLSTSVTLDCRDNLGGIETVWLASVTGSSISFSAGTADGYKASFTFDNNTVTGEGDFTGVLYEFQQPRQSASLAETGNFSEENGVAFYQSVLSMVINKMTGERLNALDILGQNTKLVAVVKDNNGRYFIVGNETGGIVTSSTSETGTAFGDRNGMTVEITGFATSPMYELEF